MFVERNSTNSTATKAHRKVKVAIGKSKGWSDGVRIPEPKKNGRKKVQSRGNDDNDVNSSSLNEKSIKTDTRGEKDMKLRSGIEGFEPVFDGGRKRKRIYGGRGIGEVRKFDGDVKKLYEKSPFKVEKTVVRSFFGKEKNAPLGKGREFQDSSRKLSMSGRRIFKGSESIDKKNRRGKVNGSYKVNYVQENDLGNGKLKKRDERKGPLATKNFQRRRKDAVNSVEEPPEKRFRSKKILAHDLELKNDPPMKKKRVIRIDRNDISNKRLDDDIADSGNTKEKKDLAANNDVELSNNAKFRAIRPSSSILSFVEDNLLGRRREIEFRKAGYNIDLSTPLDNIPFSTSSERERIEVPVFRNKLEFFAAAKISSSFPSPDLPEIAFAGRSNVGKSSLLNALTRQWGVVRTSDKPGLTQTINFFKLGPKLSLVDLPGYGFAYAKEEVKEAWEELVKEYVSSRVGLKRVCLLIDTKWGMKQRDHELIDLMERSQTKYQIVLTKTDTVFPVAVARRAMEIEESLKAKKSVVQPLMMVSSKTGAGIISLRTVLANIARFVKR